MARYCSPQLSVRTRLSPPYRATIRLKVFQGRNSISWAKSVLPVFIKASRDHPGSLRQLQIVDTALCPETRITPGVQSRRLSVNRTAVGKDSKPRKFLYSFAPSAHCGAGQAALRTLPRGHTDPAKAPQGVIHD